MRLKGRKGTPINLSISDDIQFKGYKMAREDKRSLTGLIEYLLEKEWYNRHE